MSEKTEKSGEKELKFVLLAQTNPNKVFCMLLEGEIYICREWEVNLMKTFDTQDAAQQFLIQLQKETGHWMSIGFVDYMNDVPFVENVECLGLGQRDFQG